MEDALAAAAEHEEASLAPRHVVLFVLDAGHAPTVAVGVTARAIDDVLHLVEAMLQAHLLPLGQRLRLCAQQLSQNLDPEGLPAVNVGAPQCCDVRLGRVQLGHLAQAAAASEVAAAEEEPS
eukprot:CAMPEP_0204077804 /NCGR_PEP_ID=MMETSP0360-20130528/169895_1 /ASSEMBLY_ACC=CAM_ASM_000342 /TAXON_ID=268821 /ORGANISM="Scrippsiella Hangoei, Strain SHTV-5" /LENGTH=121 /DNA_ID=CAMNT_0051026439 /DNA_START=1 /DNA_END=366 /DNA_ORIENTATION=+